MRIYHPLRDSTYYDLKPSAFSAMDSILYTCIDLAYSELIYRHDHRELIPKDWNSALRAIKYFVVLPTIAFTTLPIMVAATPLTTVIDIIVGIAECIFCKIKGFSNKDIRTIAHCKFVISPIQQLAFSSLISIVHKMTSFVYLKGAYFWLVTHPAAKRIIQKLPTPINSRDFSIFATSGIIEDSRTVRWKKFLHEQIEVLNDIDRENETEYHPTETYQKFQEKCIHLEMPKELLNVYNSHELDRKIRRLVLSLHPDKNPNNKLQAEILFNISSEAKIFLESSFI